MSTEVIDSFIEEVDNERLRKAVKILDLVVVEFDYLPMESIILMEDKLTSDKIDEIEITFITIFKTILSQVGLFPYIDISLDDIIILMHFITDIGNKEVIPLLEPLINDEDPVLSVCYMIATATSEDIDPINFASEVLENVDDELYIKIKRLIEDQDEEKAANANILVRIENFLRSYPNAVGKTLANRGITGGISANYLSIFKEKILSSDKHPDDVVADMISLMIIANVPAAMIKDKMREVMNEYIANTPYVRNRQELFIAISNAKVT